MCKLSSYLCQSKIYHSKFQKQLVIQTNKPILSFASLQLPTYYVIQTEDIVDEPKFFKKKFWKYPA